VRRYKRIDLAQIIIPFSISRFAQAQSEPIEPQEGPGAFDLGRFQTRDHDAG